MYVDRAYPDRYPHTYTHTQVNPCPEGEDINVDCCCYYWDCARR